MGVVTIDYCMFSFVTVVKLLASEVMVTVCPFESKAAPQVKTVM